MFRAISSGLLLFLLISTALNAQTYTSYFTGDTADAVTTPAGGICMMGGSTESDPAMRWFLQRANGGDVLVLRTSGSDGYNNYMYAQLGVNVNSVETIVTFPGAAQDSYVQSRIMQAEAIWFAGGNQNTYVVQWLGSPIADLVRQALQQRNIVIGGTSAGMAILGDCVFRAGNGTVTSAQALADPYNPFMTIDCRQFLDVPYVRDVITDTHYDDPDRRGRHVAFMARMVQDSSVMARGIACDEFTAVCIDSSGLARVYGDYPSFDDNAYFLQANCGLGSAFGPETCTAFTPLTWNRNNTAVKVYAIKGDTAGSPTFDLNDWQTGTGGVWEHWWVDNGSFSNGAGTIPNCNPMALEPILADDFDAYPMPFSSALNIGFGDKMERQVQIFDVQGRQMWERKSNVRQISIPTADWKPGVYVLLTSDARQIQARKIQKQ